MSLEGELKVALRLRAGRIAGADIASTRPDIATRLLQGRRTEEAQAAVPLLFSVCAHSQAAASRLACAAAAGLATDSASLARARAALAEETLRETAWQLLLHQPRWMNEAPTPEATSAARAAQAWRWGDKADERADTPAIAWGVFGSTAQAWLQRASWPDVIEWAAAGQTAAARYLHGLAEVESNLAADAETPLLPPPAPAWLTEVAVAAAADTAYTRAPLWRGRPAETGALARRQADQLLGTPPSRLVARHVARLQELAMLLDGRWQPGLGALTLAPGSGVAWADNARGLLVHHVQLDGDHVRLYRIVAPTEWNFHPQGALSTALAGAPAADTPAAQRLALRLINSLDPCVSCTVEVTDA